MSYTANQKAFRAFILDRDNHICFYCGENAHQIEFTESDPDGAISHCRSCMAIIDATWFLKEVQPADRVDFIRALRHDKGIRTDSGTISLRERGEPRNYRPAARPKPQARWKQKMVARNSGDVV